MRIFCVDAARFRVTPGAIEAIPANLAALERARAEVYRARGLEDDHAHHAGDAVTLMISGASLRVPETVRLLSLEFDFTGAIEAVRRGDKPPVPPAKPTLYAVARSRYRVHIHVLEPWQFAFLGACGAQGSPPKMPAQRRNGPPVRRGRNLG